MNDFRPPLDALDEESQSVLIKAVLGFLGVIAFWKLLPRAVSFFVRRWVLGLVAEVIFVVIAALLTEKLAGKLTGRPDEQTEEFSDFS